MFVGREDLSASYSFWPAGIIKTGRRSMNQWQSFCNPIQIRLAKPVNRERISYGKSLSGLTHWFKFTHFCPLPEDWSSVMLGREHLFTNASGIRDHPIQNCIWLASRRHSKKGKLFICPWPLPRSVEVPNKLVNGSRVGQVGPVDSSGQAGDLDPSLVNSCNLSWVGRADPSTHVDRSEISTRPGQNDKLGAKSRGLCNLATTALSLGGLIRR